MERRRLQKLTLLMLLIFESSLLIVCRDRDLESREETSSSGLRPKRRLSKEGDRVRILKRLIQESYEYRRAKRRERQQLRAISEAFDQDDFDDIPSPRPGRLRDTKRYFEVANEGEIPLDGTQFCCPHKFEVIQPNFGRNRTGHMVELFSDERVKQSFHETICQPNFANRPCKFIQGQNYKKSKCVQQHTYAYALVRWDESSTGWSLDHIRIRSGCVCQVMPNIKKKKHRFGEPSERSRRRFNADDDDN